MINTARSLGHSILTVFVTVADSLKKTIAAAQNKKLKGRRNATTDAKKDKVSMTNVYSQVS